MGIPDEWLYEYAVVRYVPRVDREEFLNIGLIMMNKRRKWLKGKIALDESRLRALNPFLNMEGLIRQARLFEMTDVPGKELPVEEKYRWLSAVKSACLQVSPSHPGLVPATVKNAGMTPEMVMNAEFNRLFTQLVEI